MLAASVLVPAAAALACATVLRAQVIALTDPEPFYDGVATALSRLSAPDDTVFVWGNSPQVYLLAQRPMGTRFSFCNYMTGISPGTRTETGEADADVNALPDSWRMLFADLDGRRPRWFVDAAAAGWDGYAAFPVAPLPGSRRATSATHYVLRERRGRRRTLRARLAVKVGMLCENYFPTLGGEQEHIYNLRRHLESPARRLGAGGGAHHRAARSPTTSGRVRLTTRTCCGRRDRSASTARVGVASHADAARAAGAASDLRPRAVRPAAHPRADATSACRAGRSGRLRGPIVGTLHSYFTPSALRDIVAPWYRYVMGRMTHVIAVSRGGAADAIGALRRFQCTVIGNGVDCDAFEAGRPLPAVRRRHDEHPERRRGSSSGTAST